MRDKEGACDLIDGIYNTLTAEERESETDSNQAVHAFKIIYCDNKSLTFSSINQLGIYTLQ